MPLILSGVYYPTTNLFIIEALNIIDVFDECMSQELELKACIDVMKSTWLDYYANIPIIYLLWIIFYLRCKLDSLTMCLKNYYNFLDLDLDVDSIVSNIKSMFYSLYDEYVKFYGLNLNINVQQDVSQAKPSSSTWIGNRYQLLFQKYKKNARF